MTAKRIEVPDSLDEFYELAYEKGWTDGFPIIPPTEDRVGRMTEGAERDPEELITEVPPLFGRATVEKVAINAVMAGCRPEYMPVIIAALKAMSEPEFNLFGSQITTAAIAPLIVINGPIRKKLDINCGYGCLGPGWRANATIGRAIRLILINLGGAMPGVTSRCSFGSPMRYSYCMGENEERNPWEPLHVEKGYPPDANTVTVFSANGYINISEFWARTAVGILTMVAHSMIPVGTNPMFSGGRVPLVILGPDQAKTVAKEFTKTEAKRFLVQNAAVPVSYFCEELQNHYKETGRIVDGMIRVGDKSSDVNLIIGGGSGPQSLYISTHFPPVTKPIA